MSQTDFKKTLNFSISDCEVDKDFIWTEEVEQQFVDAMEVVYELRNDNDKKNKTNIP